MARRKKSGSDGELKGDEWLATYADTITLLMTFFVLLYSMASVDSQKIQQVSQAFQVSLGGESGDTLMEYDLYNGTVPLIGGEADIEDFPDETNMTEQEKMFRDVKKFVQENNLDSTVDIVDNERGIVIQLRDNILFETASSALREESKEVLNKINSLLGTVSNAILVEGHTDNRDIKTAEFPSNWELSTDRAVNVVRYFVEVKGQNPTRFSAAGYGEHHPIAPNDTYENMSKNRRVNILIVTTEKEV